MAQRAAIASIEHQAELLERVATLSALRDEVWSALVDQGWSVPRPHGNFVWLPTGALTIWAAGVFADNGIVARAFAGDGLRVSIGERDSVDKLLRSAAEVVRKLPTSAQTTALD
jgi:histidinol-phosphate aminotransferase